MTTSVLGQKRWSCPLRPFTRDELANDRSFLAWRRTVIALFRLGFVVSKVALLVQPDAANVSDKGLYSGVGLLVLAGAALVEVGYLQHAGAARTPQPSRR